MSLIFGRDTICPQCRKRDRRKLPYANGRVDMSRRMAQQLGRKILWSPSGNNPYDTVVVRCPTCDGKGYVTT